MKRLMFFAVVLTTTMVLLIASGCKKDVEPFTITGIWEVNESRVYDDGETRTYDVQYRFTGSDVEGTVNPYPRGSGVWSGHYSVDGDQVVFTYSHGRGPAWFITTYTGTITPELKMMSGSLSGYYSHGGTIYSTWTGTFLASKIAEDDSTGG